LRAPIESMNGDEKIRAALGIETARVFPAETKVFPAETKSPHPEERPAGPRLEGWATRMYLWPILRDASLRDAPQDEVMGRCSD
jgi:hypothetical protein